jgi:hypothetical protein
MPENLDAWRIYAVVSGQLIMGPGGPVDISHDAIYRAMDLYEVENKRRCFERVTKLGRHLINQQNEKWKAERESRDRISRSKGRY